MILAVLEARCGVAFGTKRCLSECRGRIANYRTRRRSGRGGGAVVIADRRAGAGRCVAFGEIGLSGEIRRVSQPALRMKESVKLGFTQAIMPQHDKAGARNQPPRRCCGLPKFGS